MSPESFAGVPLVFRLALAALVFVVGGAKVYQFLTPGAVLLVFPLSERERRRSELRPAPFALVWGTSATTLLIGFTCLVPGWMLVWLEEASRAARDVVLHILGTAYPVPSPGMGGAIGPLPVTPPSWAIALGLASLLIPALFYPAWRLGRNGSRGKAAALALGITVLLGVSGSLGATVIEDLVGGAYHGSLKHWVRHTRPASPNDVWGEKGPVLLYARPTQYKEVERGILYTRRNEISESGEMISREEIYPFRVGRVTVEARPGEDLVVAGVPSAYEGVIITQEPLRIGGYLDGGALAAGKGLKLYIAPAEHPRWRDDIEELWGGSSIGRDLLPPVYVGWLALALLWGLGVGAGFFVPSASSCVQNEEDEP